MQPNRVFRLVLALTLLVAGLFVVSEGTKGTCAWKATPARQMLAQRYPLRQRTNNFYARSKISYSKGK